MFVTVRGRERNNSGTDEECECEKDAGAEPRRHVHGVSTSRMRIPDKATSRDCG